MHNELAITISYYKELILFINTFLAYIMRANLKTLLNNVINVIPIVTVHVFIFYSRVRM